MNKKKKVNIKNEIHNTMRITKKDIQEILINTVRLEIKKYIKNSFHTNGETFQSLIKLEIAKKLNDKQFQSRGFYGSQYKSFEDYIEDKILFYLKSYINDNYDIVIKKRTSKESKPTKYPKTLS